MRRQSIDTLTLLDADEKKQFMLLGRPSDCFALSVQGVAKLDMPFGAAARDSRGRLSIGLRSVLQRQGLHILSEDMKEHLLQRSCSFGNAQLTIGDVLQIWGENFCQAAFSGDVQEILDGSQTIIMRHSWRDAFFDSLVSLPRPQVQPPPMPAQADDMDESEFASELDRTADLVRELVGKLPQLDEPLRMRCMSAVSILDQASDDLQHRGTSKSFFAKCVDLIHVVLHADMLKDSSKLKGSLISALTVSAPPTMQKSLIKHVAATELNVALSAATVSRARLTCDAAYAYFMRDQFRRWCQKGSLFYLWLDSSPQARENWLLARVLVVEAPGPEKSKVVASLQALASEVDDMYCNIGSFLHNNATVDAFVAGHIDIDTYEGEGSARDVEVIKKARQLSQGIASKVRFHCFMPGAMFSKTLWHILSALFQSWFFETHGTEDLAKCQQQVMAVCSDMGTEIGTADSQQESITSWLPECMQGTDLRIEGCDPFEAADCDKRYVFPNAFVIPGINHITDNCTKHLFDKLIHGKPFLRYLEAICDMITTATYKKIFVNRCLIPQGGDRFEWLFEGHGFRTIKEWRWHTLTHVLQWLLPMEICLRRFYDSSVFSAAASKAEDEEPADGRTGIRRPRLNVELISEAIVSPWFWQYCKLLQECFLLPMR